MGLVKDADVMVQCSDSESFGLSVIESLACGVPVIVTRTCPWSEIETNGCGFWVEQTAPAIAAAMSALAGDPVAARPHGRARRSIRARSVFVGRHRAAHGAPLRGPHITCLRPSSC